MGEVQKYTPSPEKTKKPKTLMEIKKSVDVKRAVLKRVKKDGLALKNVDSAYKKDKDVVLAAIRQNNMAIKFADKSLMKDRKFMRVALRKYGHEHLFQYADESLKKDRSFVMTVVKKNKFTRPIFFKYADISLRKDRDFVMALVKEDQNLFIGAHSTLKKDRDFVMAVIKKDGYALRYADKALRGDKKLVMISLKQTGAVFPYVSKSLRNDKEVATLAIIKKGNNLQFTDKLIRADREIVLIAIGYGGHMFKYADESLKKNRDFLYAAILKDGEVIKYADKSLRKDVALALRVIMQSSEALQYFDKSLKENKSILNALLHVQLSDEAHKKLVDDLRELNIDFPERFSSYKSLQKIISNRKNIESKNDQPLAVVIYPKEDWNGAFNSNEILPLIKNGYRVVYFEAENENDVYNSLKAATTEVGVEADLFVLGGHGSQTHTSLGSGDPAKNKVDNEEFYIDTSDKEEMESLVDTLANNSVIILQSCSTGKGRSEASNVANLLRSVFPQSRIFAPTVPTSIKEYEYDRAGRVIKPIYNTSADKVYLIKPEEETSSDELR